VTAVSRCEIPFYIISSGHAFSDIPVPIFLRNLTSGMRDGIDMQSLFFTFMFVHKHAVICNMQSAAATILRRPEPTKVRVEPTTFRWQQLRILVRPRSLSYCCHELSLVCDVITMPEKLFIGGIKKQIN